MKNTAIDLKLAMKAHEAVLLFQRRMRLVRLGYKYPIRLAAPDAILLSLLANEPQLTPQKVAQQIDIPKSKVSRLLARLEKENYLSTIADSNDRRVKILSVTQRGRDFLMELDRINSSIALDGTHSLSESERQIIAAFLGALADGLGSARSTRRPAEHVLVPQQRRVIQISGMVAREYMESGLDIGAYQLLFELYRSTEPRRFLTLCRLLPFENTKLSRNLSSFHAKGWVKRLSLAGDKRASMYLLTDRGRENFLSLHRKIATTYIQALSKYGKAKVEQGIALIQKMLDEPELLPSKDAISVEVYDTDLKLREARRFLVEELVRRDAHHKLGGSLLPVDNLCLVAKHKGELEGIMEIEVSKSKAKVLHMVYANAKETPTKIASFFNFARKIIAEKSVAYKLILPKGLSRTQLMNFQRYFA